MYEKPRVKVKLSEVKLLRVRVTFRQIASILFLFFLFIIRVINKPRGTSV